METDGVGDIMSVISAIGAIGAPFAVYLAWKQLEVAKRGSNKQALTITREKVRVVNGDPEWNFNINAAGPGSFYELSVHLNYGGEWRKIVPSKSVFDRTSDQINVSSIIPQSKIDEATLVLQWATGAKNTEGLDDQLAMVHIKSGQRHIWRGKRFTNGVNWWNRRVARIFHDEHALIRPIGKWKREPDNPTTYRSNPGWPGSKKKE